MPKITEVFFSERGALSLRLDSPCNISELFLYQRITSDVWDHHYRKIRMHAESNGLYTLSILGLKSLLELDREIVFDVFSLYSGESSPKQMAIDIPKETVDKICFSAQLGYCKLVFRCYKNASGALSARLKLDQIPTVSAELVNGKISFYSDIADARYILARNSTRGKDIKFDISYHIPTERCGNADLGTLVTDDDICSAAKDRWLLLAEADGIFFPVKLGQSFDGAQIDLRGGASAKVIRNDTLDLFVISSAEAQGYPRIKVAVSGSCFSRQMFNSRDFFNPDYKSFYECGLTAYHFSFCSMFSDKIKYDSADLVGEFQSDLNAHGASHFNKDIIKRLREYAPDYLVIDNYVNISAALIKTGDNQYIDENYYLVDTPAFKKLHVKKRIAAQSEEHFRLFEQAVDKLKTVLPDIIDEDHIVLVRTHPAINKLDEGKITEWESSQIIKYRRAIWKRYDSRFLQAFPRAKVIDMRDESYVSERSQYFKFAPSHFGSKYYRDMLAKFNEIVLLNILKHKEKPNG